MSEPTQPGMPPSGGEPPYGPGAPPPPPMSMYGAPPGGSGDNSGGAIVAAVLALVLVAATIVSALVAHNADSESRSALQGPNGAGASSLSINGASTSGGGNAPAPAPTLSTTSVYSPTAAPSPTHQPLDSEAINRTFEGYMNALLDHNMYSLRSATCPRLRHTLKGFALHGKYLRRWEGLPYQIYNALDYVRLSARVYFASPYTGSAVYDWYVERTSSGHYYVCGFLS